MKKLLVAFAFIGFLATSSFAASTVLASSFDVEFCDDDKNCTKKDCKHDKKACTAKKDCKKGDKKACAAKSDAKKSCCSKKDGKKSCSKGKTKEAAEKK